MITISNLSMLFGSRLLFDDVNLLLTPGNRYGLVGANGSGKTTFLKILGGQEEATLGEISLSKYTRVGWMQQDQYKYENDLILEVVLQGKESLWKALEEKGNLLKKDQITAEEGMRLAELEEIIADNEGYTAEAVAHEILGGLGIHEDYHLEPLSVLSGGYKLRVLLAQALFNNPDVLLLDEPTNHLDIVTIGWLENYLRKDFKGLLLFISHDHDFLNNLSTHILDIDYGEIIFYTGNFDQFLVQKQAKKEQIEAEKATAEKRIAHLQSFVDRFRAKATKARQAQSKLKQIERIEIPEIQDSSRRAPHFAFKQQRPSGKEVLEVEKVSKRFEENQVLKNVSFKVKRGEKVAILGPNGVGKSTLLKILTNHLKADEGQFIWGYETHVSYFAQDHHEQLEGRQTLLNWLEEQAPDEVTQRLRGALGQMLFTQDDAFKSISSLSGGEAARLLMASIILAQPNVIVLDEPTNHLDLEAREALASALHSFPGTVLFVSHDRHFVSKVANRILALSPKGLKDYPGNFAEYLHKVGDDYLSREWLKGRG